MTTMTTVSLLKKQKVEKKLPTKVKTRKAKFIIARISRRIFPGGGREDVVQLGFSWIIC